MRLIIKLILAILLGVLIGLFASLPFLRVLVTIRDVFGNFINFIIPFLIIFFIASGIAGLGQNSGRAVGMTLVLAYISTFFAGILSFFVVSQVLPTMSSVATPITLTSSLRPLLKIEIQPLMSVLSALLVAFLFGFGVAKTQSKHLKILIDEGRALVEWIITKIIIPFLPVYIGCIFAILTAEGIVVTLTKTFGAVFLLILITHWLWLFIQYGIAGIFAQENPFNSLRNMLPAYVTALGTMSSAASIPVTLQAVRNNGISHYVADFTVPLCATIHLSGSAITIVACAYTVMNLSDTLPVPNLSLMIPLIGALGLMMIAAPGVPGGAIMTTLGLLSSMLGFDETALGLMVAFYIAQDSFGTAANVTGDGAISLIIDRWLTSQQKCNEL